jgi:hypothetical protein
MAALIDQPAPRFMPRHQQVRPVRGHQYGQIIATPVDNRDYHDGSLADTP